MAQLFISCNWNSPDRDELTGWMVGYALSWRQSSLWKRFEWQWQQLWKDEEDKVDDDKPDCSRFICLAWKSGGRQELQGGQDWCPHPLGRGILFLLHVLGEAFPSPCLVHGPYQVLVFCLEVDFLSKSFSWGILFLLLVLGESFSCPCFGSIFHWSPCPSIVNPIFQVNIFWDFFLCPMDSGTILF